MASLLERLLGRGDNSARATAKKRLQVVIMHDRSDIPQTVLEQIRRDILVVLAKYVEIDEAMLDVNLERENDTVALVANIPIRRVVSE